MPPTSSGRTSSPRTPAATSSSASSPARVFANLGAGRRDQPRHPQRPSRRCSRPCRSRPSRSRRLSTRCRSPSSSGDPEPDGDGGDLPAAGGPARPLLLQAAGRLPDAAGAERDPQSDDLERVPTVEKVADGAALIEVGDLARDVPISGRSSTTRAGSCWRPIRDARACRSSPTTTSATAASPRGAQTLVLAGKIARCWRAVQTSPTKTSGKSPTRPCGTGSSSTSRPTLEGVSADRILDEILSKVPE